VNRDKEWDEIDDDVLQTRIVRARGGTGKSITAPVYYAEKSDDEITAVIERLEMLKKDNPNFLPEQSRMLTAFWAEVTKRGLK